MAPHKKQFIVAVQWKDIEQEHTMENIRGKTDYYGPFIQSEAEVKLWMARFSNVNQGKIAWIEHKTLIKP